MLHKIGVEVNDDDFEYLKEQCELLFPNRKIVRRGTFFGARPSAAYMATQIVKQWITEKRLKEEDQC